MRYDRIPSPIICFPFFLEIQLLVTLKITENNLIFFPDFFTTQLILSLRHGTRPCLIGTEPHRDELGEGNSEETEPPVHSRGPRWLGAPFSAIAARLVSVVIRSSK
jgi:hypothetical protein